MKFQINQQQLDFNIKNILAIKSYFLNKHTFVVFFKIFYYFINTNTWKIPT